MSRTLHALWISAVAGTVLAVAPASAAWAHGAEAPAATNYRTEVTNISPAVSGVTVRPVEGGYRLELTNSGDGVVEVIGYAGEPFLEIRPDGAYENQNSPTVHVNETGDATPSGSTEPAAAPDWRRISRAPVVSWHDHRATHAMSEPRPAVVTAAPEQRHLVAEWSVPVRIDGQPAEITGRLEWLPPPEPGSWWAVILLGAAAVATIGRFGRHRGLLAATVGAGAMVGLGYAVGRVIDAGATGAGSVLRGLATAQTWSTLAALGAFAAAGYALRRGRSAGADGPGREARESADFALALGGACLAIFGGLAHAVVFARSVAPVPWDPQWARTAVAVVIAAGAGVAVAAVLRLRAASQVPYRVQPTP